MTLKNGVIGVQLDEAIETIADDPKIGRFRVHAETEFVAGQSA